MHDFFLYVLIDYLYDLLGPFFLFTAGQNAVFWRLYLISCRFLLFFASFLQISKTLFQFFRVSQLVWSTCQQLLPILLTYNIYFFRRKEDVGHIEIVQKVALFYSFPFLENPINNGHWCRKKLFVLMSGNNADNWKRILKRPSQHAREKMNGMGKNIRVVTNKHHLIFKHQQRPYIYKIFESEHAEHWENPFANEISFTIIPTRHKCQFLLINQSQLVFFIESNFLCLQVLIKHLEKLHHALHLESAVSLLDSQFDVFFIVLVNSESFHLYNVNQISQYLFIETKKRIVRHDTENSLGYSHLKFSQLFINRTQRILLRKTRSLMTFAFDCWHL